MTFKFKIHILGIDNPEIWRDIRVPAQFSFFDLHEVLQVVMGWEDKHLFRFCPNGWGSYPIIEILEPVHEKDISDSQEETLDAMTTKLSSIFKKEGQKYSYIYDFGDSWEHLLVLEKITSETTLYPACIAGNGVCPPEDCGGTPGYSRLKEILEDKNHPEYEEAKEWCLYEGQEEWDPAYFKLQDTQNYLVEIFTLRSGLHN